MRGPSDFQAFLADYPVFDLGRLAKARDEESLGAARNQIKKHVRSGRVKAVARGIYAAVPPGLDPERFRPDPFLVAHAARRDGIFAYHSALELLGHGHSAWNVVTLHCKRRRLPIRLHEVEIHFLATPTAVRQHGELDLGTRQIIHQGLRLTVTGPERALVEGMRRPSRAGGLDELIESVQGFALIDFPLLERILEVYDERTLWAAVGWLTERYATTWRTPELFTARCRRHRPRQNQYIERSLRGGRLVPEWRLIVPRHLTRGFEGHAADL